jgi:hypothetical protein
MPFDQGTALKGRLEQLVIEGGGGGGGNESYELGALYYARNCHMPSAIRPIFIFVADEAPYPKVTKADAKKFAKVDLEGTLSTEKVFAELQKKFSVYLVHKAYADGGHTRREWVRLLGEDHLADLDDPNRVVDVIFGILANETRRVDYFRKEIEGRQEPAQIDVVYKALSTIHRKSRALPAGGKSTLHKPSKKSKAAKKLL